MSSADSLFSPAGSCFSLSSSVDRLTPSETDVSGGSRNSSYARSGASSNSCLRELLSNNGDTMRQEQRKDDLAMNLARAMVVNLHAADTVLAPPPPLAHAPIHMTPVWAQDCMSTVDGMAECKDEQQQQQQLQVKMLTGDVQRMSLPNPIEVRLVVGAEQATTATTTMMTTTCTDKHCQTAANSATVSSDCNGRFACDSSSSSSVAAAACGLCAPLAACARSARGAAAPQPSLAAAPTAPAQYWLPGHLWSAWLGSLDETAATDYAAAATAATAQQQRSSCSMGADVGSA